MVPPRVRRPSDRLDALLGEAEFLQSSNQEAAGGDLLLEQRIAPAPFLGRDHQPGTLNFCRQPGDPIGQRTALQEQFHAAGIGDEVLALDRVPELRSGLAERT
jgi:hypothetical protein